MRLATGVLLWVVAAVAATTVGLVAVSAISTDIFGAGQAPLSQSDVDSMLTGTTAPPTTSSPAPPQNTQTDTQGGTVLSRCTPTGLVEIVSTIPKQGYRVDGDDSGTGVLDDHPSVKFESGDTEIEVRLRCVRGVPQPEIKYD